MHCAAIIQLADWIIAQCASVHIKVDGELFTVPSDLKKNLKQKH